MSVAQMQGVPAHLETLKCNDGKRRHPARCIFVSGKPKNYTCTCPQCDRYMGKCSTQRCNNYEEKNQN